MKNIKNPSESEINTVSINGVVVIPAGGSIQVEPKVFDELVKRYGFLVEEIVIEEPVEPKGINIIDLPVIKEQIEPVKKEYEEFGFSEIDNKKNEKIVADIKKKKVRKLRIKKEEEK